VATELERAHGRDLTDEQRRALTARGVSIALSAGAGCGKTFVLTERFVGELTPAGAQPVALGQIIAITFTDRAAREMRDRIRRACHARLLDCAEAEVDYWLNLIRELDSARISTIHSFCGTLLRGHAVEAGLDPRFSVLDAAQAGTLLRGVIETELRAVLSEGREATIELLVGYGLDRLTDMVEGLLGARNEIDWAVWAAEAPEQLVARWHNHWRAEALPRALERLTKSAAGKTVLETAERRPCPHPTMQARFDTIAERLPGLARSERLTDDLAALHDAAKVQGPRSDKWDSLDDYERFKEAAAKFRDEMKGLGGVLAFDAAAALPTARHALEAMAIAARVAGAYETEKDTLGVLDFDDLLILARRLLTGPASASLRAKLAAQVRLLLVDEFQDTDPLQVELVRALCHENLLGGKLFFVGDLKQSIYRFRGAQPQVFRALRQEMPDAGRLPLSLNFRSQPGVIEFVNSLFAHAMDEYEPLRAHRPQLAPRPSVELLWANEPHEEGLPPPRTGNVERLRRLEADWIARRIRQMLDDREPLVVDGEGKEASLRPAAQGDIAILFRALTNVQFYEEALRRYGIEYYLVGGKAFYSQQEVFDLLNLLRAVDNPADDLSLLGALRSPFFSLHDETIYWLKRQRSSLSEGLADSLPDELDDEQRRRTEHAATVLRELRELKDRLPVAALMGEALARTGYDGVLLGEFLGERKLANLHKLIDRARSLDASGLFTLDDYIVQLSEFVARQPDEALAATYPEKADVVRLMSIHQSKGLEFPVVFVADVARRNQGSRGTIRFSPELGPMIPSEDGALTGYDLCAMSECDEDEAECVRLFYVAVTRAADYLVLASGVDNPAEPKGPWMELLAAEFDLTTGSRLAGDPPEGPLAKATLAPPPFDGRRHAAPRRRDLAQLAAEAEEQSVQPGLTLPPRVGPILADGRARRQLSFSRLTGKLVAAMPSSPNDVDGLDAAVDVSSRERLSAESSPGADARQFGTLVHDVLAEVDLARPSSLRDLVARRARATDGYADAAIELLERFLSSPRAADMARAARLHRELEFLLRWPPEAAESAKFIQGFIDCIYQDAGGAWRIVDYKTNRVTAEGLAAAAAPYEIQMLLYALAAETVLKEPPQELVLHFLRTGMEHRFEWNAGARQRLTDLVNQAIGGVSIC
jgi:ATP-dependent helicase/nuclease subunit A